MARSPIIDFEFTDRAIDKIWRHGIHPDQLLAVLANRYVITRNRPHRAAPYILLGRDEQNRCLAIPIVPTDDPMVWRPITAWYCKPSEVVKLR